MNYRERIISDHHVMLGKPVVKGTRLTVELLLRKLSEGATIDDLLTMYPNLQEADVLAALYYASNVLANEEVIMLNAA
ncbi:DUF433 domain-containing protein [Spirosoma utsteinense]|uniref:DUF433 domain-containing protein n=1 Tax=Spirosoma utsteinense TaxID=2585773 RepID=A0ABR6W490_9BACT|nr:DUF433 domain-containing protein [Spirosoma utsteinense]MBC3788017.1 putative protein (DUF433 family) [Spirosoma utsteinense]MBC3791282.1 putative protein (DUF433 family) [Spirosoma utsteinense]